MITLSGNGVLVFAYGSNMLKRRIGTRCPSALALGIAELSGYELCWHKKSKDESGKRDVVVTDCAGAVVYGVLYQVASAERPALDRAEGLGDGYEATHVTIECNGASHDAIVYYATTIDKALRPYTWYKALVVAGAREHGLPAVYVAQLESTVAVEDRNRARHAKNMSMVNGLQGATK